MIVLVHLGGQRALARVVRRGDQDRLDLCVPVIYEDGHAECLEIFGARRGIEDGQWQELEPLPPVSVPSAPEPVAVEVPVAPPVPAPRLPALVVR